MSSAFGGKRDMAASVGELARILHKDYHLEIYNIAIYLEAMTHRSYANENYQLNLPHNERLEFLGDAVIEIIIREYLFRRFNMDEGEMTRRKSMLVSKTALAACGRRIGLGNYLLLGTGEEATGGRRKPSIIADAFEALVGAIFMDLGLGQAQVFVLSSLDIVKQAAPTTSTISGESYKTLLSELAEKLKLPKPRYDLMEEAGPAHEKSFRYAVYCGSELVGTGVGKNKKDAQQDAARSAYERLKLRELEIWEEEDK
jgi:ribonuclease-3